MADSLDDLAGRTGWTVEGGRATFGQPGQWHAVVRKPVHPARPRDRYVISVIDPHGRAAAVRYASEVWEAARVAEGSVRGRA